MGGRAPKSRILKAGLYRAAGQMASILAIVVLGLAAIPDDASAAGTLDQEQADSTGGAAFVGSAASFAQTFTAGSSGRLDQVDLFLARSSPATTLPLELELRGVDLEGAPDATVLASATLPAESVPESGDFVQIPLAAPVPVVSGGRYAIVAHTTDTDPLAYSWFRSSADVYAGGAPWLSSSPPSLWLVQEGYDLAFRTYVVPLPELSIDDVSHPEGDSGDDTYTFTITRSGSLEGSSRVTVATGDDTATVADGDYAANSGEVEFAAGEASKSVDVSVNGDTKFEPDEDFEVRLSDVENATIADATGVGTISNDDGQPAISIDDVTQVEGNSGSTEFAFTLSLSNPSYETITVSRESADGSATGADGDYSPLAPATVSFSPGEIEKQVGVDVNGDTKFEPDEDFEVRLSDVENATIADGTGVGTISNDDGQPAISIDDVARAEGNSGTSAYVFTVSLSNPSYQTITVSRQTANGSATVADADYTALAAATLAFAPDQTSREVTVSVKGDTKFEPIEEFALNLTSPTNASVADGQGSGTITNDDGQPAISVNDVTKSEGSSGSTAFAFTVSLSNRSYQTITVSRQTANGSATVADADYTKLGAATLTLAPGQAQKQVTVNAKGDAKFEPDEDFLLNLATPTNATVADGQGRGTISNDDGQPAISIDAVTQVEGDSGSTEFAFTLSLSNPSYQTITVSRQSADDSATAADSDYGPLAPATVSFSPGQTQKLASVNASGDTKYEPDEDFLVDLASPANATVADGQGRGTIANDDPEPPPGYAPPYDPDFIVNRPIPAGFPTDPNNAAIVSRFVSNLKSTKLVASVHGNVPPVNIASLSDPVRSVSTNNVTTQFRIPSNLAIGTGADYPVEILDPNPNPVTGRPFTELRIWQARWKGSTLTGSLGGLFHYNNDGAILNPDATESLSNAYQGGGAGNGLSYLAGLIRPEEVVEGAIKHTIRFAYSSSDVSSSFRPPARKSDQSGSGAEMGTIFQLDPTVDCSARTAAGQTYDSPESRFVRIFCVALQRYGAMISDGTGNFRSANFYLEGDGTAHWSSVIGSEYGTGNYGWLLRSKEVAYSSTAPPPTRDSDGIPWLQVRVIARPAGHTSW
jgi:Calx-beta domain